MNVVTRPRMSVDEFLAWEERQEARFEFDGREPREMVGGTSNHSQIKVRVYYELYGALRGSSWVVYPSEMKVRTASGIRYPDAFVSLGPAAATSTVRDDPVVVFEVLSDSSGVIDRTVKNAEYRAMPSVLRYVMLEQDRVAATVFSRAGEDWVEHLLIGRDASLEMPEIDVTLPLGALYEGMDMADAAAEG